MGLGTGLVFHERIAYRLSAVNSVSDILGPGRIGRCQQASITLRFAQNSGGGEIDVEYAASQDFPSPNIVIDTVVWSAPGQTAVVDIPPKYMGGFVRTKLRVASSGDGYDAWAQGRQ